MLRWASEARRTTPIISVGDTLKGGFRFESIPDGISLQTRGKGTVDLFVNHETSTVPFPFTPSAPTGPLPERLHEREVTSSRLSQNSAGVLAAGL